MQLVVYLHGACIAQWVKTDGTGTFYDGPDEGYAPGMPLRCVRMWLPGGGAGEGSRQRAVAPGCSASTLWPPHTASCVLCVLTSDNHTWLVSGRAASPASCSTVHPLRHPPECGLVPPALPAAAPSPAHPRLPPVACRSGACCLLSGPACPCTSRSTARGCCRSTALRTACCGRSSER